MPDTDSKGAMPSGDLIRITYRPRRSAPIISIVVLVVTALCSPLCVLLSAGQIYRSRGRSIDEPLVSLLLATCAVTAPVLAILTTLAPLMLKPESRARKLWDRRLQVISLVLSVLWCLWTTVIFILVS